MPARCGPLARGSAWCSCPPLRHTDLGGSPSYLCPYPRAFVAARSEAAHRSKAVTKATARRFCEEELDSLNGSGHTRAVTQGSASNKNLKHCPAFFLPHPTTLAGDQRVQFLCPCVRHSLPDALRPLTPTLTPCKRPVPVVNRHAQHGPGLARRSSSHHPVPRRRLPPTRHSSRLLPR